MLYDLVYWKKYMKSVFVMNYQKEILNISDK
jgi:hypothetical protein